MKLISLIKKYPYVFLGFIAFASGLFWVYEYAGQPIVKDAAEYDELAQSLLKNHFFGYFKEGLTMFREPGYPAFLAIVYFLFGHNVVPAMIMQILLFCGIVLLTYWLGKTLISEIGGIIAGVFVALFPSLAGFSGNILSEMFFTFLFVSWSAIFLKAQKSRNNLLFFISGIILGLSILTKAITLYFIPFVLIYIIIVFYKYYKLDFKKILLIALIFFAAVFSIVMPWMLRNKHYFNTYSITERGGWQLWIRSYNSSLPIKQYGQYVSSAILGDYITLKIFPDYSGDYRSLSYIPSKQKIAELTNLGYDETEIDDILMKEARLNILNQPFLFMFDSIVELIKFNTPMNLRQIQITHMFVETHPGLPNILKISVVIFIRAIWGLFLGVVIYGIYKSIKNFNSVSIISLIVIGFSLLHSLVDAVPRFSVPLYPFYFILFYYGLSKIFPAYSDRMEKLFKNPQN
ncbi:MAG: glycosyltransferase family 39 protein [bacterium]|nr:glycosyltransferase family 39 protein [bacterium]